MFKLSTFYKKGLIVNMDYEKEIYYMKRAAELGLVDAQHNYACMLIDEKYHNKGKLDYRKSLAWFVKAAGRGFRESRFNAAKMLITGSPDLTVKSNKKAA